jgi:hypothetical protein
MTLLDPKNDFVFKRLFVGAPKLLAALINAVRSTEPPVEVVEILNPRIDPEELAGKFIVLDVLAQDADGRRYNIEMQVRRYGAWSARSAYYLARTLTQQLNTGEDYQSLKSAIGIHLLDFELFTAPEHQTQAVWCVEPRNLSWTCSSVRLVRRLARRDDAAGFPTAGCAHPAGFGGAAHAPRNPAYAPARRRNAARRRARRAIGRVADSPMG